MMKPIGVSVKGDTVIIHFSDGERARFFAQQMRHNINAQYGKLGRPAQTPNEAVRLFHIGKGCCDGSDPSGCHRRKTEQEEAARREAKEAVRRQRALEADEYDGTEPSEGDQVFCPLNASHSLLKMGDRCGSCGWLA